MKLYTYFRSSAAYRVRIALNYKGLPYEAVPVHLVRGGGEQKLPIYKTKNPLGVVPTLEVDGAFLTQSMAILEWLEETHPTPPLLPADATARAYVRAIAQTIACDIHPINNLRVLVYLQNTLGVSPEQKTAWYQHWVRSGLEAVEALLQQSSHGRFCYGDTPTLADCCLVPQVFNARRFDCPLDGLPHVQRIAQHCAELDAFVLAEPGQQPDAE